MENVFSNNKPMTIINLVDDLNVQPEFNVFATEDKHGNVNYMTNKQFTKSIKQLSEALYDMNLGGSKIGICSTNNINYLIADAAISSGVGMSCNINPNLELADLKTILIQIDCEVLFCSINIFKKLRPIRKKIPVKKYIVLEGHIEGAISFDDVLAIGEKNLNLKRYESMEINYDFPCKIIYEKVNNVHVLNQRNIVDNIMIRTGLNSYNKESNEIDHITTPMYDLHTINSVIYYRIFNKLLTYIS